MVVSLPRVLIWIFTLVLVLGCTREEIHAPPPELAPPPPGMLSLLSQGHRVSLGSSDAYAKTDEEWPRPTVDFRYDFFLDSTEVTQAQYLDLMGRNPVPDDKFGQGPDYPVYFVTFYDALLFCNARSKAENRDTVYAYTQAKLDGDGRAYDLVGLNIHFEKKGYRLPTEAEWEFAARDGKNTAFPWGSDFDTLAAKQIAWFNANADGKTHPVGYLQANSRGFKDLFGNVMEWVNDWKAAYPQGEVQNFLGAQVAGALAEKAVKGGAFSFDLRYLRPSARSANYATLPSSSAEYVGFRCALGAIPNGHYASPNGVHAATPPVNLFTDGAISFFKRFAAKLVFVNTTSRSRTLALVDFTRFPVRMKEYFNDTLVFTPALSPDGNWVAYGHRDEGDARPGPLVIRSLGEDAATHTLPGIEGCIPRWWVDEAVKDTFLVYASTCRYNLDPDWSQDKTYRVLIRGGWSIGQPEVIAQGGYHDGLSDDGQFFTTGFPRLKTLNRLSGATKTLFSSPGNGKRAKDTSQVCNVSLPPDFSHQPEIMLLDFGDNDSNAFVGRPYGLHEILFRIDTAGKVTHFYGPAPGYVAWQDAEWSNHKSFAIAVGEDKGRNYSGILAINLDDRTTLPIAKGNSLRQPSLWISKTDTGFTEMAKGIQDSMALYDTPARDWPQSVLAAKMKLIWEQRNAANAIFLGSSHVMHGISPEEFKNLSLLNLAYAGGGVQDAKEIFRHYALPSMKRLSTVFIEIHLGWMFQPGGGSYPNYWDVMTASTLGYRYDKNHGYWDSLDVEAMDWAIQRIPYPDYVDERGFIPADHDGWGPSQPVLQVLSLLRYQAKDPALTQNLAYLDTLVREATMRGKQVGLVVFPQSPNYRNTKYYGKYGPTRVLAKSLLASLQTQCEANPLCRFYDAHLDGKHDFDSTDFADEDHLSPSGAIKLSHRLDSLAGSWVTLP